MTYPTFNNGDALPASDLNAIGLWLVSTTTIGSGVTSVPVNNCFSSTYRSYRILIEAQNTNGSASHLIQLNGITGSVYYTGGSFGAWAVTAQTDYGPTAQTNFIASANNAATTGTFITLDLHNPFETLRKYGTCFSQAGNGHCSFNIYSTSTASATGFTLSKAGDTMTGGTIRVFGYRN